MSVVTLDTTTKVFDRFIHLLDPVPGRVTKSGLIEITN
jgi:hypothetical protein